MPLHQAFSTAKKMRGGDLGVCQTTIYRAVARGKIRYRRTSDMARARKLVDPADILAYLDSLSVEG